MKAGCSRGDLQPGSCPPIAHPNNILSIIKVATIAARGDNQISVLGDKYVSCTCINHNLSKAVWQAGCNAALIAKDKSCSLSGYLSSQACR